MRLPEALGETADSLTDPGYDRFPGEPEGDVRVKGRAGSRRDFPCHVDEIGQVPQRSGKSFPVNVGVFVLNVTAGFVLCSCLDQRGRASARMWSSRVASHRRDAGPAALRDLPAAPQRRTVRRRQRSRPTGRCRCRKCPLRVPPIRRPERPVLDAARGARSGEFSLRDVQLLSRCRRESPGPCRQYVSYITQRLPRPAIVELRDHRASAPGGSLWCRWVGLRNIAGMAYDQELADRVREHVEQEKGSPKSGCSAASPS